MAVHFSNHVRRRTCGPLCDVIVEVFLGDDWYEVCRTTIIGLNGESAFQDASDVGHALVPILEDFEALHVPIARELRAALAYYRCRLQALIFDYRTQGKIEFCKMHRDCVDDPDSFDLAFQNLTSSLRCGPSRRH